MTDDRPRSATLPLFRWGEALRARKLRQRRIARRATVIGGLVLALGLTIARPPRPLLVWNASASAPTGLYMVGSREGVTPGSMVIARVPAPWRRLAATRHYLPGKVPLVKRVAAAPGDTVCALGQGIFVNGRRIAERLRADRAGRPMPWWSGCTTLRSGTLFLLMADSPTSFDGRYFGLAERHDIIGTAHLLWAG